MSAFETETKPETLAAKFDSMKLLKHSHSLLLEQFSLPAFATRKVEQAFWVANDERKFAMRRFFMFFGTFAFLAHGVLDYTAGGDHYVTLVVLRTICVGMMLALAFALNSEQTRLSDDTLVTLYLLLPALTIISMTLIVDAGTAAETYPFGLVILFAYGGTVLVPRCFHMAGLCIAIYAIYISTMPFSAISHGGLVVNLFFVTVGMSAICIGSLTRERLERQQMSVEISIGELNEDLKFSREEALVARDAAVEARRTQTKFITSISHELRTPLNAIIGFSDLMLNEIDGPMAPPSYQGYVNDIHRSGQGLLLNINDLLDVQRLSAGKMSWTDARFSVTDMVRDAIAVCRHEAEAAEVALIVDPVAEEVDAFGDIARGTQVITNLLTNALKFTDPGGRVTISQALQENGDLRISIADTGIGIAAEDLERVKNPFQQGEDGTLAKKKGGLGLGLAIVGGILDQIDGQFHIESELGVGTTCHVTIPRKKLFLEDVASVA